MSVVLLTVALATACIGLLQLFGDCLQVEAHGVSVLAPHVPLLAVPYLVLWSVGTRLNKRLNKELHRYTRGQTRRLRLSLSLRTSIWLMVLSLIPYLLYVLGYAAFATVVGGAALATSLPHIATGSVYLAFTLAVGIGTVVVGTAIGLLIGAWRLLFPHPMPVDGLEVTRESQRRLWAVVDQVAAMMGTRKIEQIFLSAEPTIYVHMRGGPLRVLLGFGRRVLTVGLPATHRFTIDEFKCIVAHELGHFHNKDTHWGLIIFAMSQGLTTALCAMPGPMNEKYLDDGRAGCFSVFNPIFWALLSFYRLFERTTAGLAQVQEVLADVEAITLFGGPTFGRALLKTSVNSLIFRQVLVPRLAKERDGLSDFHELMERMYRTTDVDAMRSLVLAAGRVSRPNDSHPALCTRLRYAQKSPAVGKADTRTLHDIFEHWGRVNNQLAYAFNKALLAPA